MPTIDLPIPQVPLPVDRDIYITNEQLQQFLERYGRANAPKGLKLTEVMLLGPDYAAARLTYKGKGPAGHQEFRLSPQQIYALLTESLKLEGFNATAFSTYSNTNSEEAGVVAHIT